MLLLLQLLSLHLLRLLLCDYFFSYQVRQLKACKLIFVLICGNMRKTLNDYVDLSPQQYGDLNILSKHFLTAFSPSISVHSRVTDNFAQCGWSIICFRWGSICGTVGNCTFVNFMWLIVNLWSWEHEDRSWQLKQCHTSWAWFKCAGSFHAALRASPKSSSEEAESSVNLAVLSEASWAAETALFLQVISDPTAASSVAAWAKTVAQSEADSLVVLVLPSPADFTSGGDTKGTWDYVTGWWNFNLTAEV